MKLLSFIIPVLSLEFALLVSSQTVSELVYQLIAINEDERSSSVSKLRLRYDQTSAELLNLLNRNTIPSLNEIDESFELYIKNLEIYTSSAGYDPTACVRGIRNLLESNSVANVVEKATNELRTVYETIVSNAHFEGVSNLQVISNEVNIIGHDFTLCISSAAPEYCNRTLSTKVIHKQTQLPILYNKEVERTTVAFTQIVVNYENRIQDYLQEARSIVKPYLELLESCISILLIL